MIKIDIKSTVIPVEIGELNFEFDMSDESIKQVDIKHKEFLSKIKTESDEKLLDEGFAIFLGEGAFEKIYKQTPSMAICTEYLWLVIESLYEEMANKIPTISQSELAKEYLNKKNKK